MNDVSPSEAGGGVSPTPPEPVRYHAKRIFAVLDDEQAARHAVEDLRRTGFDPDAIMAFTGEAGAELLQAPPDSPMMLLRQFLADIGAYADQYAVAAESGHFVLRVLTPDHDARGAATEVLQQHGGSLICYFGRLGTDCIDPADT